MVLRDTCLLHIVSTAPWGEFALYHRHDPLFGKYLRYSILSLRLTHTTSKNPMGVWQAIIDISSLGAMEMELWGRLTAVVLYGRSIWSMVGRCIMMRWRNADVREESILFQSWRSAEIVRLLNLKPETVYFERMGESGRLSSTLYPLNAYVTLRIYLTTSGLLLSSLRRFVSLFSPTIRARYQRKNGRHHHSECESLHCHRSIPRSSRRRNTPVELQSFNCRSILSNYLRCLHSLRLARIQSKYENRKTR